MRHVSEPIEFDTKDLDIRRMLKALERGEFMLYYQPQVSTTTGEMVGAEALIRWQHPTRGLLLAGSFLPALQDLRFARRVGEWATWQARQDIERWWRAGLVSVPVAVNMHPDHIAEPYFAASFLAASGGLIDIEIVEEPGCEQTLVPSLTALRAEGVRVALDDFGIGYSSFGRLIELPIDILKIDKSFVSALTRSRSLVLQTRTRRILSTLAALSRLCKFTTVAEGVETQADLDAVRALGIEQSQGYLHSPAVSAEAFGRLLPQAAAGNGAQPRRARGAIDAPRMGQS
ncbi:MAG: EAL domain-containing protein [Steroidobacteraceae bacterium]